MGKLGLIRVSLRLIESGIDVGRADVTTQGLRLAVLLLEDSDKEICQAFAAEVSSLYQYPIRRSHSCTLVRTAKSSSSSRL